MVPQRRAGQGILLVANGKALRGLRMYRGHLTPAPVVALEIWTGSVHVYRFDAAMRIVESQNL